MQNIFFTAGTAHQYDSFAYPHIVSESKVINLIKRGVNFLASGTFTTEQEITLPDQDSMQSTALKEYLKDFEDMLCLYKSSSLDTKFCIDQIMNIFFALREVHHCINNCFSGRCDTYISRELSEVILDLCI